MIATIQHMTEGPKLRSKRLSPSLLIIVWLCWGFKILDLRPLAWVSFFFAEAVSWVKKTLFLVSWNNLFCLFIHLFLQMRNVPKENAMKNIQNCEVKPQPLFE